MLATAVLHSRLAQFAAIGGVLFAIAPRPVDTRRIDVSSQELMIVDSAEASRHGPESLTPAKRDELASRVIEDKMLFQEGLRLGLDQDDPIIRQRVVEKVLLLAEDLGGASRPPTAAEVRAEYARAPARYSEAPRLHVMQVFASTRDALPTASSLALAALPAAGEPFPLPRETTATRDALARDYGEDFAAAVVALPIGGAWSEPIASTYGWHRVRVVDQLPARVLPLAQVADRIAFELALHRREDVMREFLTATAARYELVVDGAPLAHWVPPMRTARRQAASGED